MMHVLQWCTLMAVGLLATACKRQAADGGGPLPPVDSRLQARDSIQNPFDEIAPGVFSRVVYRTPPSAAPAVEVRDIELAQGKAVAALTFPGAAVIEIRNGKVQAGGTFGLSQGDSLQLANTEAGPLSLRVYVIGSR
jgi:hypothetical protein